MNSAKIPFTQSPNFWLLLSVIAFLVLPSQALDYGLLESTADEFYAAMGWSSLNLTSLWFLPLIGFFIIPKLNLNVATQAKALDLPPVFGTTVS